MASDDKSVGLPIRQLLARAPVSIPAFMSPAFGRAANGRQSETFATGFREAARRPPRRAINRDIVTSEMPR